MSLIHLNTCNYNLDSFSHFIYVTQCRNLTNVVETQISNKVPSLVKKTSFSFQEVNVEQWIIQEKSFPYVIGEQFLRPLLNRIQGLFITCFTAIDKHLSFPIAKAADVNNPAEFLENVFKRILVQLNNDYKTASAEMQEAFKNFENAVQADKGWKHIEADTSMNELKLKTGHELNQAIANSQFYVNVFSKASQYVLSMQENMNQETLRALNLFIKTQKEEFAAKLKLLQATIDGKDQEIATQKGMLYMLITQNNQLVQHSYFLKGKAAIVRKDVGALVSIVESMIAREEKTDKKISALFCTIL